MRKILPESKWLVTLTPAGQAKPIQKEVEAPTQDAALRRAMQGFTGMQFLRAEAVSMEPQVIPPGQQPLNPQQQLPKQMAGLRPLQPLKVPGQQQQQQQQESINPKAFSYPYSIRLPGQFSRVLRESSPVTVNETHGQYEIVLMNETEMRDFLGRLHTHRNRDVATIILDGIRSSYHWGNGR